MYGAATKSELLVTCGREHIQERKRSAAMRASWNRLSDSDKQFVLEVCCRIRDDSPEYRMGACPALQQNWKAAAAQLMKVEELCLQLVDWPSPH